MAPVKNEIEATDERTKYRTNHRTTDRSNNATMPKTPSYDLAIIGGGPAGLASAAGVLRARPDSRVVVLEKRREFNPAGAGIVVAVSAEAAGSGLSTQASLLTPY